jgi:hypothetical protein
MVQAAAAGVIDFGRADPRDPKWWRYLRLILDQLERQNLKECYRLYNDRILAMLSRSNLTKESTELLLDDSETRITSIIKLLFPWLEVSREEVRKQQAVKLREAWESWFGKLDDPETQRRINETAEWLRNSVRQQPRRVRQVDVGAGSPRKGRG